MKWPERQDYLDIGFHYGRALDYEFRGSLHWHTCGTQLVTGEAINEGTGAPEFLVLCYKCELIWPSGVPVIRDNQKHDPSMITDKVIVARAAGRSQ